MTSSIAPRACRRRIARRSSRRPAATTLALRQEVERLLAADQRAGSVFDSGSSGSDSGAGRDPPARDDSRRHCRAGARLGPYVIVGAAGHGGMGEVYRARDTRLDRTVALKVLPLGADPRRHGAPRDSSAKPAPPRRSATRTSARCSTSAARTSSTSW